jgi:excisionase family DNA binding protein
MGAKMDQNHHTEGSRRTAGRGRETLMEQKAVYTTGEAAEICKLSQQTIIRCFDAGQLKGFRVPGSKFRRIPHDDLLAFMKENNIPLDDFEGSGLTRVLVVDDDPQIVELFVDVLKSDGRFEVATATTGYDAGMTTQQFNPDIVVLDYMLPDINGNVVCQTIRANPDLARIKILIISGMVNPSEVSTLMEAGADDFIKKPFNIEKVIGRICEMTETPAKT